MSTELAQPSLVEPTVAQEKPTEPVGFGGWLLIVMIGQTLMPLLTLITVPKDFEALATPELPSGLVAMLLIELAMAVGVAAFQAFVTVAMYRKRRSFPLLYRVQFIVVWVAFAIDVMIVQASTKLPMNELIASNDVSQFISMALWLWYVSVPVRVRNTFTA